MRTGDYARNIVRQLRAQWGPLPGPRKGQPYTVTELREVFGSNRAIAIAAGLTPGTRPYKTLLRRLQRYGTSAGQRRTDRKGFLEQLADRTGARQPIEQKRTGRPRTDRQTLARIRREGYTVHKMRVTLIVSKPPARHRVVQVDVFLDGEDLEEGIDLALEGDWPACGLEWFHAWWDAYTAGTDAEPDDEELDIHDVQVSWGDVAVFSEWEE